MKGQSVEPSYSVVVSISSIDTQRCIRIAKNKPPASRFELPPSSEIHMVLHFSTGLVSALDHIGSLGAAKDSFKLTFDKLCVMPKPLSLDLK